MVDTSNESIIASYVENQEIIEIEEPTGDISSNWIVQNEDLKSLENGIPIVNFISESHIRNKEMEFRVK